MERCAGMWARRAGSGRRRGGADPDGDGRGGVTNVATPNPDTTKLRSGLVACSPTDTGLNGISAPGAKDHRSLDDTRDAATHAGSAGG